MVSNFKSLDKYNITKCKCIFFLEKKKYLLVELYIRISESLEDGNCFGCNIFCGDKYDNEILYVLNNIKCSINKFDKIINSEYEDIGEVVNILRTKYYYLTPLDLNIIKDFNLAINILDKMQNTHELIKKYIEDKILSKILFIEKNQKILISNQKMILESLNQINGNEYTIKLNKYLDSIDIKKKLIPNYRNFYNNLSKKFTALTMSANVLSSGEISVNKSMMDVGTYSTIGSLQLIETLGEVVPLGKAFTSIAYAAGIYYINEKQLNENIEYNKMIDSVMHTEGISKLNTLLIIKQLDATKIKKEHLTDKYVNYFCNLWKEAQRTLIKNKKLPLFRNDVKLIEQLVINITNYHNILSNIVLKEFILLVNNKEFSSSCINCIKSVDNYIIKHSIIDDNMINNIILSLLQKRFFIFWKNIVF